LWYLVLDRGGIALIFANTDIENIVCFLFRALIIINNKYSTMKTNRYLKTVISSAGLIIFGFTANAQITITKSDIPVLGSVQVMITDTVPPVTPGAAGANVSWNLSGLTHDGKDSLSYFAPWYAPDASAFPSANLAIRTVIVGDPKGTRSYEYDALSSNSKLERGSYIANTQTNVFSVNTPSIKQIPFPATYNTTWKDTVSTIIIATFVDPTYAGDTVKLYETILFSDTIDGWGSLTTPATTYTSVLRVKQIATPIYDSSYTIISGTGYPGTGAHGGIPSETFEWLANNDYVVAQLGIDTVGKMVHTGSYLTSTVFTGINEITNNSTGLVYPNPASTQVNIVLSAGNKTGTIRVFDIAGRQIESQEVKDGKVELNTTSYNNGIYLYRIADMNGNVITQGKFDILHQ